MDKNKKPLDPVTWTIDFLPLIQGRYGSDITDLNISGLPPRPNYMTCPSRLTEKNIDGVAPMPHYSLVMDSTEGVNWRNLKWHFRDRPKGITDDNRVWYVGVTTSFAEAKTQLRNVPGPHTDGRYNQSDSKGNPVLLPRPN